MSTDPTPTPFNPLDWLKGKKSYVVAVLTIAVAAARALGYPISADVLVALAGAFGITLRMAVADAKKEVVQAKQEVVQEVAAAAPLGVSRR